MKKFFNFLREESKQLFLTFVQLYPDTTRGSRLRKNYWSKKLKSCGINSEFRRGCSVGFPELIVVGDNFIIGHDALMTAGHSEGIYIGDNVSLSRGTFVHATNHKTDNVEIPIMQQGVSSAKIDFKNRYYSIVIEDNVWIGSNTIILSGTHLKTGCVVSAGSVISGAYDAYSVIGGNPGRMIKKRK